MIHSNPSPLAGTTITVDLGDGPEPVRVEDWWDRVAGRSWMDCDGNPAALTYAMRSGLARLPIDNNVLYGKRSTGFGMLFHTGEVRS